jgi:tripartite-type tricarboxylate transporter receptor subunit TctC
VKTPPVITRRSAAAAIALTALGVRPAQAQEDFPNRAIRIVVGSAAGTGPDIIARLLANQLSQRWPGAGAVVQNTTGSNHLIAAQEVARAAPDGYTLLLGPTSLLSIAPLTTKLPIDLEREFTPVSLFADSDFVLLVNPERVPARSPKEFLTWAKAQKSIFMGTFGAGSIGHFGSYVLSGAADLKPEMVHYRNTADVIGALYRGDVQGAFATVGLAVAQTSNGRLVALASTGTKRTTKLAGVPTFTEAGFPDVSFTSWFGLVAPARTPPVVIERLQVATQAAAREAAASIDTAGFRPMGSTSEEFRRLIVADTRLWGKVIRETGFKAE